MAATPTTTARLMTPPGRGGIAVIALTGPATRRILNQCFRPRGEAPAPPRQKVVQPVLHRPEDNGRSGGVTAETTQLQLGEILDGSDVIDEAILAHTPRGAEINIHGGPAATRRVLQRLADLGAQLDTNTPVSLLNPAHPTWHNPAIGEELLAALPAAPSLFAATCLARQWSAGLSQLVANTLASLHDTGNSESPEAAHANLAPAGGDAPRSGAEGASPHRLASSPPPPKGEELKARAQNLGAATPAPQACDLAERLRQAAERLTTMQKLLNPPDVVLAGPPNAGKSTLANSLVARPVSIVHAMAGTTRDWIREQAIIEGRAVWLTDTAGLWDAGHDIDAEAVRRAWDRIDAADLVLICNPADAPPTEDSASNKLLALRSAEAHAESPDAVATASNPQSEIRNPKSPRPIHAPTLTVTTKADLLSARGAAGATPRTDLNGTAPKSQIPNPKSVCVSAETGEGLGDLRTAILEKLSLADIDPAAPAAFTPRQADLLKQAADALEKGDIPHTIQMLHRVLKENKYTTR